MRRKLLALLLALTMLLTLAACGGKSDTNNSEADGGTQNQQQAENQNSQSGEDARPGDNGPGDAAAPGEPAPGQGEAPDLSGTGRPAFPVPGSGGSGGEDGAAPGADGGGGEEQPSAPVEPGITHTDVTLFHEGESFSLLPTMVTGTYAAVYASGDEAVAAVAEDGTVTAVAPGATTVTLHLECESGRYDFSCIVRCQWEADVPAGGGGEMDGTEAPGNQADSGDAGAPAPEQASAPSLGDFYATLSQTYEALESLGAVEGEVLDAQYPGLSSAAGVEEVMVMEPTISFSTVAVALVRLSDGADAAQIQAVKDILQARLDGQADGGAYYLGASDAWANGVVVTAGNYVGMFVMGGEAQNMADIFTAAYGG